MASIAAFNRTTVECKEKTLDDFEDVATAFNRTTVECKDDNPSTSLSVSRRF